jgi:hypothetical protein
LVGGGGGGRGSTPGRAALGVVFGLLAAMAFALFDVLVQKWAPGWGAGRFLPVMMGFVAVYSVAMLLVTRQPIRGPGGGALWAGAACMSTQAVLLITALALYNKATAINIAYSARGLWSVLAVWLVGGWFGNQERGRGAAVLRGRLLGAALLLAAIVLAVIGGR